MVVPPAILLEPDPQILVFCTWLMTTPSRVQQCARSSGATEADSLALGWIMVWLLTVFAAIRHLRSQATTVSICRCRPSGEKDTAATSSA
jgi:hypothetical protein